MDKHERASLSGVPHLNITVTLATLCLHLILLQTLLLLDYESK